MIKTILTGLLVIVCLICLPSADPRNWEIDTTKIEVKEKEGRSTYSFTTSENIHIEGMRNVIYFKGTGNNKKKEYRYTEFEAGPPGKPTIIYKCVNDITITYNWEDETVEVAYEQHSGLTMLYKK